MVLHIESIPRTRSSPTPSLNHARRHADGHLKSTPHPKSGMAGDFKPPIHSKMVEAEVWHVCAIGQVQSRWRNASFCRQFDGLNGDRRKLSIWYRPGFPRFFRNVAGWLNPSERARQKPGDETTAIVPRDRR
jgi:hypothetical protein